MLENILMHPSGEIQTDIVPGERVRSYDFPGSTLDCYIEGTVEAITEPIEGCERYRILVDRRVVDGVDRMDMPSHVYPPVNGTPISTGGTTNFVFRIVPESNH